VRLATENLTINTIIEDIVKMRTIFSPLPITCISADETAIEKWVGLTRRIAAIERKHDDDDITLVRHIYDLNAIKQANRINKIFFDLVKTIVDGDAKQYKNRHPEYFADPVAEIRQSLSILSNQETWKEHYQQFIDVMVYDKTAMTDYKQAFETLESISKEAIGLIRP
jgi:hypothetical protein